MDKYEYRVKTEELLEYVNQKQYQKAMEIADTIDWRRVKNASMLNVVSEVYEHCKEFQKSRDILFVAYNRAPESRKIVYRLGTLALKIGDTEEALDCYEEFVKLAPRDPNQYILKYKILSAQRASLEEQIAALEEFKKAEYIEKWAYELAKLYHEAGMTKECLEECDDLILWFSEGKYVYMAMELKMKYKPLTPLQQEKYDQKFGKKTTVTASSLPEEYAEDEEEAEIDSEAETEAEAKEAELEEAEVEAAEPEETEVEVAEPEAAEVEPEVAEVEAVQEPAEEAPEEEEVVEGVLESILESEDDTPLLSKEDAQSMIDALLESAVQPEESPVEETPEEPAEEVIEEPVEEVAEPAEPVPERKSAITKIVSGATLEEALASTVAILNKEEKEMAARDEELRLGGQMRIDEILMEWEEKQKVNAEAIERQRQEDEIRLQKEREESQKRIEAERRAAEEAARKAAEEAARKAAEEEAARKAAEEAARKAAEEEAARKAAEEEAARIAAEEAARKAAEEEAARKAAEEEAARKAEEEEAARKAAEEEAARKAEEEEKARIAAEEEKVRQALESLGRPESEQETEGDPLEGQTKRLPDDIMALVEQLENRVGASKKASSDFDGVDEIEELDAEDAEDSFDEDFIESLLEDGISEMEEPVEEDDFEEEEVFEEDDLEEEEAFEEDDLEEEAAFEEDDFEEEEAFEEDDLEEVAFEEDDFEEEAFEEVDFEEDDFEEDSFGEPAFEEDDFEEEAFEDDFEELEIDEADFEEDDFEEEAFEETDFEEADFEEDIFEEADFEMESEEEEDFEEDDTPLEIEEPSEEEIQKRIKKSKGSGVPFDTGFVVTGRYDLSATSEIGLKAGLTEEQKKLFSYFVPVRGMSEQIVEVLDNDRRARREGTSRTGNILVIGRKGSGKTVLAVDIVKAIQKQRNLKQGKVAIVTGESLNKKELPAIVQKLRGGAIIVEKAGKLNSKTIKELNHLMERKTGEMLFVLEDERKNLERIMKANPEFKKKFTSKLELPIFINDELVTFGQTYAKENGYKLDEMGILALYSRIDIMQREDHAVSVAEVKDIMDEAIAHSQKANVKHLARRVFGKGTDESDRIILQEEDFRV